jgi:hypothetical protein
MQTIREQQITFTLSGRPQPNIENMLIAALRKML